MSGTAAIVAGAIEGMANTGISLWNAYQQNRAYEQNQANIVTNWAREDNAVQRRVKDLEAAGLSPTLAAGSSASSSSPISLNGPQMAKQSGLSGVINSVIASKSIQQANANIAYTNAQTELIKKQKENLNVDMERNERNLDIEKQSGVHANSSPVAKVIRDVESATGIDTKEVVNGARAKWESVKNWWNKRRNK